MKQNSLPDIKAFNADAQLAAIVENCDDAIVGKNLDGVITSWNKGAERIFGYTAKEAVGRPITLIIPPDLQSDMYSILDVIRRGGSVDHCETTRVRKDGTHILVSLTVSPIRDSKGNVVGASKIARDITGQRQSMQALREGEERFRATFEQAAVGIAHVALDGRWLRANRRLCEVLGYTREELLATDFAAITYPEDLQRDWESVRSLLNGEIETYAMEKRYIRKDGAIIWANLTVSLVRSDCDEHTYFISVIEDITDRKMAARELALQADLLDQAQEPIFVWELGGGITYWNGAAEKLYGFSREEAIGKNSHHLLRTKFPSSVTEFESQLLQTGSWADELIHTTKDGRIIVVESRQKVVQDGARSLVLESNRDVTERIHAQQQLSEANAKLEQRVEERTRQLREANKELEAFAYSVSHDLRAPLRSIDGFGQILLREYAGKVIDEAGEAYIRKMSNAAGRMEDLIRDLLNLSRIARTELTREHVDLSELAKTIVADLRARQPGRSIELKIEDQMVAQADARLLRVALDNLFDNAWKFTGKTPDARVEFGSIRTARKKVYFLKDNGAGFSMEHAGNLFAPFQRLHRDNEFEGTGIGLAIVQRVIHKHGGTISVEAEVGRGATFYFTLG